MDFREFFIALIADWVALMSGAASVILGILGVVRKWEKMPRWVWLTAAIICFFLAIVRIWTTEHRARVATERRLEALTIPKISGEIFPMAAAPAGQGNKDSIFVLSATLKNTGAPSIADKMIVKIRLKTGKEYIQVNLPPPKDKLVMNKERGPLGVTVFTEDYLPKKQLVVQSQQAVQLVALYMD